MSLKPLFLCSKQQAGGAQRKRLAQNREHLKLLLTALAGVNAVYILWRVLYHWDSFSFSLIIGLILTTATSYFSYTQLATAGEGITDDEGNLLSVTDLSAGEGMVEYYHDIIYINLFCQAVGLFWDRVWWVWLIIPGYAAYQAYVKLIFPWMNSQKDPEDTDEARAKREKKERKAAQRQQRLMKGR